MVAWAGWNVVAAFGFGFGQFYGGNGNACHKIKGNIFAVYGAAIK